MQTLTSHKYSKLNIYKFYVIALFILILYADRAYSVENFDEDAEYSLYLIRVIRDGDYPAPIRKAYLGAEFIIDSSKTRIVADGFGYAANAYGAVKIWSLSDGFDTGMDRRLYFIGDDVDPHITAYDDIDLTRVSDAIGVDVARLSITPREYLLMFSGPYKLMEKTGVFASQSENAGIYENKDEYADYLYAAYAKTLDALLGVHYFIPRVRIYEDAEMGESIFAHPDTQPFQAADRIGFRGKRIALAAVCACGAFGAIILTMAILRLARRSPIC